MRGAVDVALLAGDIDGVRLSGFPVSNGRKIGVATDCSRIELGHYLRIAGVTRLVDRAPAVMATYGNPPASTEVWSGSVNL